MWDFLSKLLRSTQQPSKQAAKERLRLVLIHDRAMVSPQLLELLKEDLISVISKYMDIDEKAMDINLAKMDDSVALVANIPVRSLRRAVPN
jgi:cell division topological specificity factor